MGIKKKQPGPEPMYSERWKEMAKDGSRLTDAARLYMEETKTKSLTDAFRIVREFHTDFFKKFRRR